MPLAIAIFVLSATSFAAQNQAAAAEKSKPICKAKIVGTLWPDDANHSHKALRQAAQNGELELCGIGEDGFRWQSLSVNVRQLRPAGCCLNTKQNDEADDIPPPYNPSWDLPDDAAPRPTVPHKPMAIIRWILGI